MGFVCGENSPRVSGAGKKSYLKSWMGIPSGPRSPTGSGLGKKLSLRWGTGTGIFFSKRGWVWEVIPRRKNPAAILTPP
jgi:hypothetical protein